MFCLVNISLAGPIRSISVKVGQIPSITSNLSYTLVITYVNWCFQFQLTVMHLIVKHVLVTVNGWTAHVSTYFSCSCMHDIVVKSHTFWHVSLSLQFPEPYWTFKLGTLNYQTVSLSFRYLVSQLILFFDNVIPKDQEVAILRCKSKKTGTMGSLGKAVIREMCVLSKSVCLCSLGSY